MKNICLTGEYKTEVHEVDLGERPIVRQIKSLSCYNSEQNKGNPEAGRNDVRWMHNGHLVRNDATRYDGASTRVIQNIVEISHPQEYSK